MRTIDPSLIKEKVAQGVIEACRRLPREVIQRFKEAQAHEPSPLGKEVFEILLQNARLAQEEGLPLCQDTGLAVVFVKKGEEVFVKGLEEAIDQGVAEGYKRGFLRKSVADPLTRKNTGTNTPAVIHLQSVPGETLEITLLPKGCGSENMSRLVMLPPAAGLEGVKEFVVETVSRAGPNPCPPVLVGVGIGGSFEKAALLAKLALTRPLGQKSAREDLARLEEELLEKINRLGLGPLGFGGLNTALAVHIEAFPTHIASLPVAVNLQCHAVRIKKIRL